MTVKRNSDKVVIHKSTKAMKRKSTDVTDNRELLAGGKWRRKHLELTLEQLPERYQVGADGTLPLF